MSQKYETTIDTFGGPVNVSYTDEQIDGTDVAYLLRNLMREGAFIAPSEIAAAAWRELERS